MQTAFAKNEKSIVMIIIYILKNDGHVVHGKI